MEENKKTSKDYIIQGFRFIGLGFLTPIIKIITKEEAKKNVKVFFNKTIIPVISVFVFFGIWSLGADSLHNKEVDFKTASEYRKAVVAAVIDYDNQVAEGTITDISEEKKKAFMDEAGKKAVTAELERVKIGDSKVETLPRPGEVWDQVKWLWNDIKTIRAKKKAFAKKTEKINAKREEQGKPKIEYTGRPSFLDQIMTSLATVLAGFLLALFIAVPAGIMLGLSETLRNSVTWIVQLLRPVSPVVWLLLVTMIVVTVTKVIISPDDAINIALGNMDQPPLKTDNAFRISFISVGLCAMWATLVNTSLGVSSVDPDIVNVAKVLKLGIGKRIFKVILPSSIPLIFTGLRITLSVSWMVVIAIELLAQSPGLGTFVWEEFQNGSSASNSKIIVAMIVIGFIGFLLDRAMAYLQDVITGKKPKMSLVYMTAKVVIFLYAFDFFFLND